jgi:ribosomal protein S18 acetylase RimI-like enzyme
MKIKAIIKNRIIDLLRFRNSLKRPSKTQSEKLILQRREDPALFVFRDMTIDDVPAIARLHVKAWNETYWYVSKPPSYEIREWQWKERFTITDGSWFCIVIENQKKELIGFAMGSRYAHEDLPLYSGELDKLYLLQEYQRLGLGRKLICMAATRFVSQNIHNMVLFGEASNPTCAFYEAMGGERLYAANGEFHGGYGWLDLSKLVLICNDKI